MSQEHGLSLANLIDPKNPAEFIHATYFPSWATREGVTPSSMDLTILTHVYYAFASVSPDGTVGHVDTEADVELPVDRVLGRIRACIDLKQKHPIRVLISIGGEGGGKALSLVASSAESRKKFAQSVRKFVEDWAFDGVDVDWEGIDNPKDGKYYVLLLQALHLELSGYQLTSALPAGEWCLRNIDLPKVNEYLDLINLMCYDLAGPWSELSGHHAQLHAITKAGTQCSGDSAIQYLLTQGVAASRIVLGIPVYGRSFSSVTDIDMKALGHGEHRYVDLPYPDSMEFVDFQAVAAGCVSKEAGFITYDIPATVKIKARYTKAKGLAGLFYWTGAFDQLPGPRSLISAGYQVLSS